MRIGVLSLIFIFSIQGYAQYNHAKEWGLKGKIKKVTTVYYSESIPVNGSWAPRDSMQYNYKTITYFNARQNIDSIATYIPMGTTDYLATITVYDYEKNERVRGRMIDFVSDLYFHIKYEWVDQRNYTEHVMDSTGENKNISTVWLNERFSVIKKESQLYRDGSLQDHSVTETRYPEESTGHCVSVTKNQISRLEYSLDEYVELRDKAGNPLKCSCKTAVNTQPALKYFLIEYYD